MKLLFDVKNHLNDSECGRFKIRRFNMTEKDVEHAKMMAMFGGYYGDVYSLKPGEYIKLIDADRDEIVMSDTPMEVETNSSFVENAHGRVLVGGLGLGIILLEIQDKKEVSEIVVVEKYQEIIDLVAKNLPLNDKVKIVQSDIFDFAVEKGFDTIYFDIWNTICEDNWEDMKKLRRKWCRAITKGGWIQSWRQEDCRPSKNSFY